MAGFIQRTDDNPFRPEAPLAIAQIDPELDSHLTDLSRTLRTAYSEQIAGSAAMSIPSLTALAKTPQFKLGAIGVFHHETYGVIRGRYCQFGLMSSVAPIGSPVGLQTGKHNTVTNVPSSSNRRAAIGFAAAGVKPLAGQFGWVITDGVNLASVDIASSPRPDNGQQLAWSAIGKLNEAASDFYIAHVAGTLSRKDAVTWTAAPGTLKVAFEAAYEAATRGYIQELIDAANVRLSLVESQIAAVTDAGTLASVMVDIGNLRTQLDNESLQRSMTDGSLGNRVAILESAAPIDAVGRADFDALAATVDSRHGVYTHRFDLLDAAVAALNSSASEFLVFKAFAEGQFTAISAQFAAVNLATSATLTLSSPWTDMAGFGTATARRVADGLVALRGRIEAPIATSVAGVTLATLAVDYRPPVELVFVVQSGVATARIHVESGGNIVIYSGDPLSVSLSGIQFYVA